MTDSGSIRVFLCKYNQYCKEIARRVQRLTVDGANSSVPIRPAGLKFCNDPEYLDSAIGLDFLPGVTDYASLTDLDLRKYLGFKAEESKESVNLDALDKIVEHELKIKMSDQNAKSRVKNLFDSCHSILRRNYLA